MNPAMERDMEGCIRSLQATGMTWKEAFVYVTMLFGGAATLPFFLAWIRRGRSGRSVLPLLDDVARLDPVSANQMLTEGLRSRRIRPWVMEDTYGLDLKGRSWITDIPSGVSVMRLDLSKCTSLVTLPAETVADVLSLCRCPSLVALPDDLKVWDELLVAGSTALKAIPWVKARFGLNASGCTALERLPDGLAVYDCWLQGCTSLVRLPRELSVGFTLDLQGCTSWDGRIPRDADIGGQVLTPSHPDGLPLLAWRKAHPKGERGAA